MNIGLWRGNYNRPIKLRDSWDTYCKPHVTNRVRLPKRMLSLETDSRCGKSLVSALYDGNAYQFDREWLKQEVNKCVMLWTVRRQAAPYDPCTLIYRNCKRKNLHGLVINELVTSGFNEVYVRVTMSQKVSWSNELNSSCLFRVLLILAFTNERGVEWVWDVPGPRFFSFYFYDGIGTRVIYEPFDTDK